MITAIIKQNEWKCSCEEGIHYCKSYEAAVIEVFQHAQKQHKGKKLRISDVRREASEKKQ